MQASYNLCLQPSPSEKRAICNFYDVMEDFHQKASPGTLALVSEAIGIRWETFFNAFVNFWYLVDDDDEDEDD